MDANTAERVSQLAKNLKDLHLATTAEEAYERAKEIITGTAAQGTDKSIKELMTDAGMTRQDLQKAKELLKEEEKALRELKKELEELKAKQAEEAGHHDAHQKETAELDQDLIDAEHDVGVLEENVDLAEDVQEEDSEKQ
jgi:sugar phosphate isomerase/epimerase